MARIDFYISYWAMTWFLLYIFGWTSYNPFFFFLLGLVVIAVFIVYFVIKGIQTYQLVKYVVINALIKLLPFLYLLRNTPYNKHAFRDIQATLVIVFLYFVWIYLNKTSVYRIYGNMASEYLQEKKGQDFRTPVSKLFDTLFKHSISSLCGVYSKYRQH